MITESTMGEHRRIGANAERQREHSGDGEARVPGQHAAAVTQIPPELLDPGSPASVPDGLLHLVHAPHL